ncbi:MAG: DNA-binding NtrC family response regulator, partial [Planctomycetota bacterium]
EGILSNDASMWRMFRHVETIAKGSHPVLIWGETGTGKELIARALHMASGVSGPFVAVNVAGLDDAMFSDTLFGHCAGAFTSAIGERKGMIDAAAGGTLFLDEIGDLSESSQVKLLRLLQEGEYYRVGGDQPRSLNARIVTATHKDPSALRQDLYYRLRAYRIDIPALRDRLADLPILIEHFLKKAARDLGRRKPAVPSELFVYLSNYNYPGNIRELEALVFDAMSKHGQGVMSLKTFNAHIRQVRRVEQTDGSDVRLGTDVIFPEKLPSMREIEGRAVKEALDRTGGNQTAAAHLLGVSRPTISRHLRRASPH